MRRTTNFTEKNNILGKKQFKKILASLIVKPQGTPKIVLESFKIQKTKIIE